MTLITTSIKVKGGQGDFPFEVESVFLSQSFCDHHQFEVMGQLPVGEKCTLDMLKRVLGKFLEIKMASVQDSSQQLRFIGFVDSVTPSRSNGRHRVKVSGFSPTILMDAGPQLRTFTERSTKEVVNKLSTTYSNSYFPETKIIAASSKLFFSVQNQESDYRYLCRLADASETLFWYDGQAIVFGDLQGPSVQLKEAVDLEHLEATANLCPLKFTVKGYDSALNRVHQKQQNGTQAGVNKLSKTTVELSAAYPSVSVGMAHGVQSEQDLQGIERQLTSRQTNDLLTLRGTSGNPSVGVGTTLSFGAKGEILPGISSSDRFLVVQVSHQALADGSYQNSFLAVPADHPLPLNMPNVSAPVCGPLVAEVVENSDPENLGRVKVKFPMDLEQSTSPWIRVLTPFTGHNGFFFLPEVGEKVMVFFEDFHPEKAPFVLGSFYHGGAKATAWSDPKNKKKGWQTEKAAIEFDDNTGKLTIRATSISIEAEEKMSMTTKQNGKMSLESPEIKLSARDKMELAGGTHLKQQAARIDIN